MLWRYLLSCMVFCSPLLSAAQPVTDDCLPVPGITPICGLQAPEDLELTPDGKALIYGEFGGLPSRVRGGIMRFDLAAQTTQLLYPRVGADGPADWGSSDCPGAPGKELAPHGIHLSQRADGQWQLLVVNHWQRESIEFFQWQDSGQLTWRGCVVMPAGTWLNDVVGLANGGFYATHMMSKDDPEVVALALSGAVTGHIVEWRPGRPVAVMANSQMPFPNGIQVSADGRLLFINVYSLGEVRKVDRATGKVLAVAKVSRPDNSNWSDDGRLLVASHTGHMDYEQGECNQVGSGFCPMAFEIVAIDPATMDLQRIFAHQGAPMGAGTAAIKTAKQLYIGSFSGDRLLTVQLQE